MFASYSHIIISQHKIMSGRKSQNDKFKPLSSTNMREIDVIVKMMNMLVLQQRPDDLYIQHSCLSPSLSLLL